MSQRLPGSWARSPRHCSVPLPEGRIRLVAAALIVGLGLVALRSSRVAARTVGIATLAKLLGIGTVVAAGIALAPDQTA